MCFSAWLLPQLFFLGGFPFSLHKQNFRGCRFACAMTIFMTFTGFNLFNGGLLTRIKSVSSMTSMTSMTSITSIDIIILYGGHRGP